MTTNLTAEAVLALAPDDASAKAARGLTSPAKWPTLGADERAVWGECQGSGSKPYQTQVDLSGPSFRCSCPSRKFPCKHGLALLLLRASDPARFNGSQAPAWVGEWLASRSERAEKKEQKAQAAAAAPADPEAAAKRAQQRWARMAQAADELGRWLGDQVGRGLASLGEAQRNEWKTMAARLVDMQVPGLGQRVLDAAALIGNGPGWPEQVLQRFGLLQLACDALRRHEQLESAARADLRAMLGWPFDKAEVLAEGETLRDRWSVLGQISEERDDRLTERRVWLQGEHSGRRALLLDHAFAGKGFEQSWLTGTCVEATLAYFPGAGGLRALALELHGTPRASNTEAGPLEADWHRMAERVAACPWTPLHPMLIADARLGHDGLQLLLCASGQGLPLSLTDADKWLLLAHAGGAPLALMGEWDGRTLRPLAAWNDGGLWQRGGGA